ncbi:MAG TPA: zinc-dependent metalloprotease family protein, partial [Chitinophagaceae bacterium]|nr:zinc-dependent metalloprotease family protein [Chitinophagaceae bacterium]
MRKLCKVSFMLLLVTTVSFSLYGQNYFFAEAKEPSISMAAGKRVIVPDIYKTVVLDKTGMEAFLKTLPSEAGLVNRGVAPVIELPMPGGGTAKYRVWESPVMEPALATKFPEIKTYTGQGIDDPTAIIKIDLTGLGFHAMIMSDITGNIFIDPYRQLDTKNYTVYYKKDFKNKDPFIELGPIISPEAQKTTANRPMPGPCIGPELRSYRLAIACTGEYAKAVTGLTNPTVAQTLAAIVTSINRVDGVYEKELAISLNLVANNNRVVFVNPATDPFTANNDGEALLDESQSVITDSIGAANYDIGHTFSTGAGGIAQLSSVCGSSKARGVTGLENPTGDPFYIDYVAHEMGHQFGASHTFNATTSSCSGNRSANTAVEPGSGITIMGYAGICGATNDLAENSIPNFHGVSMDEINTFTETGNGSACATVTPTGNTAPVVNAGNNFVIPESTTFVLTGSATDANGDALTYSWEEMDTGPAGNWNSPAEDAPLFRSFVPVTSPARHFPKLSDQVRNVTTIGERLPSYARDMIFRLTARDNRAGGGGVCYDESSVTVDGNSGPFVVSFPSAAGISWEAGTLHTVAWNVANTNNSPVNCANVSIQLSIDSGYSFPITILANTPNDGSEQITVPANITTKARIRVMAVGNIFYDISNNNFEIITPGSGPVITSQPENKQICGTETVIFNVESDSPVSSYQWQVSTNGGASFTNITNANSATLTIANVNASQNNYQYRVLLTGQSGVTISDAAILSAHELPTVSLAAAPLTNLAPGLTTVLTATSSASSGGVISITWFKDETPISVSGTTLDVDVTGLGNYQVKIEEAWPDGNVCANESEIVSITATASTSLFIYPSPNDGRFTVSYFNSTGGNTKQSVTVYDAKGAKVYSKIFTLSGPYELHDIDLRGKARGVYFVVVG